MKSDGLNMLSGKTSSIQCRMSSVTRANEQLIIRSVSYQARYRPIANISGNMCNGWSAMVTVTCDVQCHDDSDYVDNGEVDNYTEWV